MVSALKRFILWDYPRAGWQYDVVVAVILAFIFLTPREWFRDQPKASSIVMLPSDNGAKVYWIEPELLSSTRLAEQANRAEALLNARDHRPHHVLRLEPIFDAEKEVKGFMVFTTP